LYLKVANVFGGIIKFGEKHTFNDEQAMFWEQSAIFFCVLNLRF